MRFPGPNCANETNECIPDQCQHHATCVDEYLAYQCMCIPGLNYPAFDVQLVILRYYGAKLWDYYSPLRRNWNQRPILPEPLCFKGRPGPMYRNHRVLWVQLQLAMGGRPMRSESVDKLFLCCSWIKYLDVIIRDVLLAIYGEINMQMVPLLDELMTNPALITDMVVNKLKKENISATLGSIFPRDEKLWW